jgi:hypothetical protein
MCGLPPLMDVHCYLSAPAPTRATLLASCCTFHVGEAPPPGVGADDTAPGIIECARRVARWAVANLEAAAGVTEDELVQAQVRERERESWWERCWWERELMGSHSGC